MAISRRRQFGATIRLCNAMVVNARQCLVCRLRLKRKAANMAKAAKVFSIPHWPPSSSTRRSEIWTTERHKRFCGKQLLPDLFKAWTRVRPVQGGQSTLNSLQWDILRLVYRFL